MGRAKVRERAGVNHAQLRESWIVYAAVPHTVPIAGSRCRRIKKVGFGNDVERLRVCKVKNERTYKIRSHFCFPRGRSVCHFFFSPIKILE